MKLDWGKSLLLFFILFLSLAAFFIAFAFRQNIDLVEDDYYKKGASYSDQIAINQRSEIYQDSIKIEVSSEYIELLFSKEIIHSTDKIMVHFFRPSDKEKDLNVELNAKSSPFLLKKEDFSLGRYKVKISWNVELDNYFVEKELFVQ